MWCCRDAIVNHCCGGCRCNGNGRILLGLLLLWRNYLIIFNHGQCIVQVMWDQCAVLNAGAINKRNKTNKQTVINMLRFSTTLFQIIRYKYYIAKSIEISIWMPKIVQYYAIDWHNKGNRAEHDSVSIELNIRFACPMSIPNILFRYCGKKGDQTAHSLSAFIGFVYFIWFYFGSKNPIQRKTTQNATKPWNVGVAIQTKSLIVLKRKEACIIMKGHDERKKEKQPLTKHSFE